MIFFNARKGNKSKQGAGHLWVLADFDDDQEERQQVRKMPDVILNQENLLNQANYSGISCWS